MENAPISRFVHKQCRTCEAGSSGFLVLPRHAVESEQCAQRADSTSEYCGIPRLARARKSGEVGSVDWRIYLVISQKKDRPKCFPSSQFGTTVLYEDHTNTKQSPPRREQLIVRLSSSTEFMSFQLCDRDCHPQCEPLRYSVVSRCYHSRRAARTYFNSVSWRQTAVNLILLGDGFTNGFRVQRLALSTVDACGCHSLQRFSRISHTFCVKMDAGRLSCTSFYAGLASSIHLSVFFFSLEHIVSSTSVLRTERPVRLIQMVQKTVAVPQIQGETGRVFIQVRALRHLLDECPEQVTALSTESVSTSARSKSEL